MAPARGNPETRRVEVSEAVWRVLAKSGFGGLRLRAVAAEMDASTGLLTHYFSGKRALLKYALDVLEQRTEQRPRLAAPKDGVAPPEAGIAMLRAAMLDILPLTPEGVVSNRIWVGSWDVALADPELAEEHAKRYRRGRERLRDHVATAQRRGEILDGESAEDLAASAQGFLLGLVVQALFSPEAFPAERQIALVDGFLGSLAPQPG
jgi:AcrR family transcriptional regulator